MTEDEIKQALEARGELEPGHVYYVILNDDVLPEGAMESLKQALGDVAIARGAVIICFDRGAHLEKELISADPDLQSDLAFAIHRLNKLKHHLDSGIVASVSTVAGMKEAIRSADELTQHLDQTGKAILVSLGKM